MLLNLIPGAGRFIAPGVQGAIQEAGTSLGQGDDAMTALKNAGRGFVSGEVSLPASHILSNPKIAGVATTGLSSVIGARHFGEGGGVIGAVLGASGLSDAAKEMFQKYLATDAGRAAIRAFILGGAHSLNQEGFDPSQLVPAW
jgi:hypothetical protein